jgi:LPXTG-site transpeptidase (sortase) family protein
MLLRRASPARTLVQNPGTRLLAILLCLSLLLGAQPVPAAHAATLTVNSTNDNDDGNCNTTHCSLREAINAASSSEVDTIVFNLTTPATIVLNDSLIIDKDLTINGPDMEELTISGDFNRRVFIIPDDDYDVTISDLTIANGRARIGSGGGIFNMSTGEVHLLHVTFRANSALYGGGGMLNGGSSPTLTDVTFAYNWARVRGGGMLNRNNSAPMLTDVTFAYNWARTENGGGMYNNWGSSPILTDVTFTNNQAGDGDYGSGGGMYNNWGSSPSLSEVTFSGNSAQNGGGMYNNNSSNPTLTDVEFNQNQASISDYYGKGGGMYNDGSNPTLSNVTFRSNNAEFGYGGGMYNDGSSPTLTDVTFDSNQSGEGDGGGMYNHASSPSLTEVTFQTNYANGNGGGMYNEVSSSPTLTGVTFSSNTAEYDGGGMYNINSSPSLTEVTFSSNHASFNNGGGLCNRSSSPDLTNVTLSGNWASIYGGGIYNSSTSDPILTHVTISGNSALYGGGIYSESINTPTLRSTILAGNSAGTSGSDCYGVIISGDYNLIGDDTDCIFSALAYDQVGVDPLLGPLADNGGETLTRALLTGSPAIDWIPSGTNGCGTTVASDQRGEARPSPTGGACDVGAFEYGQPTALPDTGFPPGAITTLPAQPTEKTYTALGGLWLAVPKLGIQAPVVSVPFVSDGWDVSWLGDSVGYLPGSAFPTWQGNTVLTAHVWDAYNRPGLFVDLKQLRYSDRIEIHAWGIVYRYEVRESRLISPEAVDVVMQHKEHDWVTLLTCEDYRFAGEEYAFRRMVRAVLVEIVADR